MYNAAGKNSKSYFGEFSDYLKAFKKELWPVGSVDEIF